MVVWFFGVDHMAVILDLVDDCPWRRLSAGHHVLLARATIVLFLMLIFVAFGWLIYFITGSHTIYYPHLGDVEYIFAQRLSQICPCSEHSH